MKLYLITCDGQDNEFIFNIKAYVKADNIVAAKNRVATKFNVPVFHLNATVIS